MNGAFKSHDSCVEFGPPWEMVQNHDMWELVFRSEELWVLQLSIIYLVSKLILNQSIQYEIYYFVLTVKSNVTWLINWVFKTVPQNIYLTIPSINIFDCGKCPLGRVARHPDLTQAVREWNRFVQVWRILISCEAMWTIIQLLPVRFSSH